MSVNTLSITLMLVAGQHDIDLRALSGALNKYAHVVVNPEG